MPSVRKSEEHANINFFLYFFLVVAGRNVIKRRILL